MAKQPNLPKFTVTKNDKRGGWELTKDGNERATKHWDTKTELTKGGALADAVGKGGGSVKIQKGDGKYQEERTYPRSRDPKGSPG
ncbi:DUF2188 domain-containing protein [Sphingomonas histidinilytica]|uniref:DUF2188 domain-containing protein n=1 Tax=Rhizorhabdus histidinilytica TaxID=439228 RepID=A0A1T5G7P5_9SPHN|nr:DUF2188 domain-containing protein [Rhizorhabdus histidinilytica]MBO9380713.1 DUF2188 domain-containing protein [Rhizorhabdus histidinilytica]QEH77156.1 DUF2188 domain-containing protein [Sphingomonas sp. C8-2]SKC04513.1 hypothetical protein SAMN06295920_11297 [Rhizorhabdus histidinilytica]